MTLEVTSHGGLRQTLCSIRFEGVVIGDGNDMQGGGMGCSTSHMHAWLLGAWRRRHSFSALFDA